MTSLVTVVETDLYVARADKLLAAEERDAVIDAVAGTPEAGSVVPGTRGLRKLRIGLGGRGKRGGGRVIYWYHSPKMPAVLMLLFAKNEAEDMSPGQRRQLIAAIDGLYDDFGGER